MQNTNNNESLSSYLSKLIDACKAHKAAVIAAAVLVVLVWGGSAAYLHHQETVRQDSWAQFYNVQIALLTQGQEKAAEAADALNAQYPDTDAAYYARLMQADLLYTQDNYAQAAELYEKLLTAKNPQVRTVAALSLGAAQQAVQEYAKSIGTLQQFIQQNSTSFSLPQAYLTLALSQELSGDKAAALETYKKILADYPQTYFGTFAKDKISQLGK